MTTDLWLSVLLFAIATTGTPGPNNAMMAASGANFGYVRSIPHVLGIVFGVALQALLIAGGLGALFVAFPWVQTTLKVIGSLYLLYLAWKIASAGDTTLATATRAQPMTILAAVLFQFVNPKAWMMTITLIGSFSLTGDLYWPSVLGIVALFSVVGFHCISLWAGFGTLMGRLLSSGAARTRFNTGMGLLTAACLIFIW